MRTLIALGICTLVACGGGNKSYTMEQQANPNPFKASGCKLAVDAVAFDKLIYAGKPEAEQLANMPPDQQARFQDEKKAFSFALKQELVAWRQSLILDGAASGENQFLMRPSLVSYMPGGEAELDVVVSDAAGTQVLDELRVRATVTSLRDAATPLGHPLTRYLHSRFCTR